MPSVIAKTLSGMILLKTGMLLALETSRSYVEVRIANFRNQSHDSYSLNFASFNLSFARKNAY